MCDGELDVKNSDQRFYERLGLDVECPLWSLIILLEKVGGEGVFAEGRHRLEDIYPNTSRVRSPIAGPFGSWR
jgi:hypothetical protein